MHNVPATHSEGLSCIHDVNEITTNSVECDASSMDATDAESSELLSATEPDCLCPDNAADVTGVYTDAHGNTMNLAAVTVDVASVDCDAQKSDTDTGTSASGDLLDGIDLQSLSEPARINEISIDNYESVTTKAGVGPPLPDPDSVTAGGAERGENADEINGIPDAVLAPSCSVAIVECPSLSCDVTCTDSNDTSVSSQTVNLSADGSGTASESSLNTTAASHHHHHHHHHRRKSKSENGRDDVSHTSAESSADLLTVRISEEARCHQLTVDNRLTDDVHRVRQTSSRSDTVEELLGAGVDTGLCASAKLKRQDGHSRLSYF